MLNPTTCSVKICFLSFKVSETEAARREREREKLINGNQKKSHLSKKIQHRCNWGGPYFPQKFQRNSRQKRRKPIIRKANPETDEQQREESKRLTYFCHAARMKIAEKVTRPMKDKNPITTTTTTTTTVFLSDAMPKLPDPADAARTSSNRNSILAARESARRRAPRPLSLRDCSSSSSSTKACGGSTLHHRCGSDHSTSPKPKQRVFAPTT
jgi:hypothetical protein